MENENIIENENIEINSDTILQTSEDSPQVEQNFEVTELAQALYSQIVTQAQNDSENIDDTENENEDEQVEQIDYTQQISDINSTINLLRSDIDSNSQSITTLTDSLESFPTDIREQFDDIVTFQYVSLSLYVGLLVAIIFFKGLKK